MQAPVASQESWWRDYIHRLDVCPKVFERIHEHILLGMLLVNIVLLDAIESPRQRVIEVLIGHRALGRRGRPPTDTRCDVRNFKKLRHPLLNHSAINFILL